MQGKKDGARDVFSGLDGRVSELKDQISHRNPGQPKKTKKLEKKKKR